MGSNVTLKAADGHVLGAYLAEPKSAPRGGVVVIQEIFGVNSHIKRVVDQYADAGYRSIAPALFDRAETGVTVPYTDMARGIAYVQKLQLDHTLQDMQAAIDYVRPAGKVGIVGYCWGGTMAYLAAARLDVQAAVSYYGGFTVNYLNETLRAPVVFHFGEKDTHIPASTVDKIRAAHPEQTFHLYPADHGFNCSERPSYDAASAKLAFERSVDFLKKYVG